jgi:hypothetical protein
MTLRVIEIALSLGAVTISFLTKRLSDTLGKVVADLLHRVRPPAESPSTDGDRPTPAAM